MKKYVAPEVEIIKVNADDIIQTSLIFGGNDGEIGNDPSIFSIDLD